MKKLIVIAILFCSSRAFCAQKTCVSIDRLWMSVNQSTSVPPSVYNYTFYESTSGYCSIEGGLKKIDYLFNIIDMSSSKTKTIYEAAFCKCGVFIGDVPQAKIPFKLKRFIRKNSNNKEKP
jgi:hypothetical protein